ncbi:MAG: hypothetical protein LBR29_05305 [Methylobacteriaceae bacterium]|nr:hypothetical protein [Methylobacteriaceae bacterium]
MVHRLMFTAVMGPLALTAFPWQSGIIRASVLAGAVAGAALFLRVLTKARPQRNPRHSVVMVPVVTLASLAPRAKQPQQATP